MSGPSARRAARVLLVDAADRILLFRGTDPSKPDGGTWWFTVGGGLEDGESFEAAASRELFEETGLARAPDAFGSAVHEDVARFTFAGVDYEQHQRFFALRVEGFAPDVSRFDAIERESILEHRWWTPADLLATVERLYPPGLPKLVDRLIRSSVRG